MTTKGDKKMNVNKGQASLGIVCILLSVVLSPGTQCSARPPMQLQQSVPEPWMIESWTGDNRGYKEIREYISQAISDGQDLGDMVQRRKAVAANKPYDPKAEYDYAYALYRQAIATRPFSPNSLIAVRDALNKGWPPHAYDYTRLRFLVESALFPKQSMIAVGERLLQHDPTDESVRKKLFDVLRISTSIADREKALAHARNIVLTHPEDADAHGDLAGAYLGIWMLNKSSPYADKAIKEYQQYLRLAPPDAEYRRTAERLIKTVEGMVAK